MAVACLTGLLAFDGRYARAEPVGSDDEVLSEDRMRTLPDGDVAAAHRADVDTACDAYPSREPEAEPLWKLGRGLHNFVFGFPAEVARNPVIEILKADTVFGVGAGAFEGVVLGVGKGFWRAGAGFFDVVTFPIPDAPWYDCRYLPEDPF
jgi:putative exosortase-associated protein (TIGR04073 family)